MPAAFFFVTRGVGNDILAMKLGADLSDCVFEPSLLEEGELLPSGCFGHHLGRVVDKNRLHILEYLDQQGNHIRVRAWKNALLQYSGRRSWNVRRHGIRGWRHAGQSP